MKQASRAKATGQTLMSQGEPMVWLTGGMFAIACTMIVALLGFILYQGLATLWQRPFKLYALNSGSMIGGEFLYEQPYTVSRQSLAELDELSREQAGKLLQDKDQVVASQYYLRTGNYDVGNRHFAFVPQIAISSLAGTEPREIWLLERQEWGVMYGFPTKLTSRFSAEFDPDYRRLQVFVTQIDQYAPATGTADAEAKTATEFDQLKTKVQTVLNEKATLLQSSWDGKAAIVNQLDSETLNETHRAKADIRKTIAEIESAKEELGYSDRMLSNCRLSVRKAELADKTDLQTVAEEAIQLASAAANIEAQTEETVHSIEAWEAVLRDDKPAMATLKEIKQSVLKLRDETLQPVQESEQSIRKQISSLPSRSKASIEDALKNTKTATRQQYETNSRLARLEEISKSRQLSMQLPIPEAAGTVDSESFDPVGSDELDAKIFGLIGRGETGKSKRVQSTALSATHALIQYELDAETRERVLAVYDSSKKQISVYTLPSKDVFVADIVRCVLPNQLGLLGKLSLYVERWIEFLFGQPREGGIEGGFFPALWGTIVMTLIMSIAVMPFGVMAALYMREYAKSGWVLSLIRISINNLAGVPSIVYGVFGLAFFCYTIGGYIDGGPVKAGFTPWPSGTWFVALGVTVLAGTGAFFLAALGSGSPAQMTKTRKRIASFSGVFWLLSILCIVALFAKSPFFNGFYEATLPNPTFGKGCLLWASCTLALLTLPVVIVATEEALSAVPNSLREGSYACGAGKWQTLQRIVLPYARPGIITGFILAMARGAGEVAPMMLVGAIPLATDLPLDLQFPFFHGSRSFMHLGFQIYSLGFQSQNSEAAKPMVFTATLLLLTIVTLLNVTAIWLRARLRKRFQSSQF